ncbi:MAG: YHYH protein, partial [Flavobacteriaceae bacterium]
MKKEESIKVMFKSLIVLMAMVALVACSNDSTDDLVIDDEASEEETVTQLHAAFAAFNPDATTIYLDGSEVVIETTGLPNHETVY